MLQRRACKHRFQAYHLTSARKDARHMEIDGNSQECVYDIPSCDENIQALELTITASGEVRPRASRPTESTLSAEASDDAVPPLMPILVKPVVRQGNGAPDAQAGVQVVKMSLLKDLRLRIDKRTLREEDLAALVPEMADVDGGGCRPQCMVCLDALEEGQEVSRQSCGHCFHHECMATWLDSQLQQKKVGCCPHCQETIVAPIIQHQQVPCAAARAEERRPSGTRATVRRFFARLFKN